MPKSLVQWATVQVHRWQDHFPVEAIQIETTRGESAREISGARTEEDRDWYGSNQVTVQLIDRNLLTLLAVC